MDDRVLSALRFLATTVTSGESPLLPTYAGKADFDLSEVSIVQTAPNVRNVTGRAQRRCALGFCGHAHLMLSSAVDLVNYGYVLLTQPDRVTTAARHEIARRAANGEIALWNRQRNRHRFDSGQIFG